MPPTHLPPEGTATLVMTALQTGQTCPKPSSGPDTSGLGILEETPASYAALTALLSQIDGEMETVEDELVTLVKQHKKELITLDDQVSVVGQSVQAMLNDLNQARKTMDDPMEGVKARVIQTLLTRHAKEKEVNGLKGLIQVLEPLTTLYQGTQEVSGLLDDQKWMEADKVIRNMKEADALLQPLYAQGLSLAPITQGLLAHAQYFMRDALTEHMKTLVFLKERGEEEGGNEPLVSLIVQEGSQEILGLIERNGEAKEWLDEFFQGLCRILLLPLIQQPGREIKTSQVERGQEGGKGLFLMDSIVSEKSSSEPSWSDLNEEDRTSKCGSLIKSLDTLMDFLKHTILLSPPNIEAVKEREDMVKEWTTTLYSHMVSKLEVLFIQHILEPLAPISSDQLPSYGRLIDVIRPWADKMRHLRQGDSSIPDQLTTYLDTVEEQYVQRRKKALFNRVMILVKEGKDWNGSIPSSPLILSKKVEDPEVDELGLSSLLHFPECLVSQQAQDLLLLLQTSMQEALSLNPTDSGSRGLGRACREVLVLYKSLSLSKHQRHISTVPSIAALFHNDWQYLAHYALILQSYYRPLLPQEALGEDRESGVVGWMDLVSSLRIKAESFLDHIIEAQISNFKEDLQGLDGFYEVLESEKSTSIERTLLQVVTAAQQLGKQLKPPMLPWAIYVRVMGRVIDALLMSVIQEMLEPIDISVDESAKMHDLTHNLLPDLAPILEEEGVKELERYIPSWGTAGQVIEMMNLGLRDIMKRVRQGYLSHLTRAQVSRLVRALFSDTELRTQSLQELSTSDHLRP